MSAKLPAEMSVARGLPARLDCPSTANPPVTSVLWSKDDRVVAPLVPKDDGDGGARLTTDRHGSLLFQSVSAEDEGRYRCTPYSPLGVGQASRPVHVTVRGLSLSLTIIFIIRIQCISFLHGAGTMKNLLQTGASLQGGMGRLFFT